MQIRRGTDADIAAVNDVERSAGDLFIGTHMDWAVGETTDSVSLVAAVKSDNLWVAEEGGLVIGFLLAEQMDGDFYIHELAVAQSHQRRGIGSELIETALGEAWDRGFRTATMTTDRKLPWNAPYYARLGFRILEREETSPKLARYLAGQPNAARRCAMQRKIRTNESNAIATAARH
jgi:ribosomal protein S18 acetylase RimI-like enzyme